jgi:hypothetical protein
MLLSERQKNVTAKKVQFTFSISLKLLSTKDKSFDEVPNSLCPKETAASLLGILKLLEILESDPSFDRELDCIFSATH